VGKHRRSQVTARHSIHLQGSSICGAQAFPMGCRFSQVKAIELKDSTHLAQTPATIKTGTTGLKALGMLMDNPPWRMVAC